MTGRILKGIGGFYEVVTEDGARVTLRAQGKLRRQRLTPMVGDFVTFTQGGDGAWLTAILPRNNSLVRPPVANLDRLVLTASAHTPKPDLLMLDRLLLYAFRAGIAPLVVLNKCDEDAQMGAVLADQYRGAAPVYAVSAKTGQGLDALRAALSGTVHAFAGQSGVGKSSLINALYGFSLETGSLSEKIERGKNTTRHAQLIALPGGGYVLDTPGFSLLELGVEEPLTLKADYPEFLPYEGQCRFAPCAHYKEPGCAVRQAVVDGKIDAQRYARYAQLFEETTQRWRERYG